MRKMKLDNRVITWLFLAIFFAGEVAGDITADPISDMLFFLRSQIGTPLSSAEQAFYWYYAPTLVHLLFLAGAIICAVLLAKRVKPIWYADGFLVFAVIGAIINMFILGPSLTIIIMLAVPIAALVLMLFFTFTFTHKKRRFRL